MRKSYIKNSIKVEEFDALIRLTAEMSKYLYPYIREILHSRDNISQSPVAWNDFKERFVELIYERFNINSMRVKKLLDQNVNDEIITKLLLNLSLNISNNGYKKLRTCLLNS